ncbi:DUF2075 domain-containing protein [Cellulomonas humilata]|uniref:DUF2075 domain-containing protein n=1 Tax=Cellulomonas humilata TaxID=144055 RepID=A0A7Y6A3K6_9CELL|nr:DUF2075 domain-containing protein [Cellulomonas humilata]NUU18468.1 DUF2075 domain-containing protein [Cellulomonas humilata]
MTSSELERLEFTARAFDAWAASDPRGANWPVVYVIDGLPTSAPTTSSVYVGETLNVRTRIRQHIDSGSKSGMRNVRVVVDDEFNKSVCLDLESHLIRWFSGDGNFAVLNLNGGITDADYFHRESYRTRFKDIFERLRHEGLFSSTITEIENSDLFKLSPFKALTEDQAVAVDDILEGLFADLEASAPSTMVIQGQPGTGKTIVAIYLMKLLTDIASTAPADVLDRDWMFADYFAEGHRELLAGFRMGLVVPQQSLRTSIQRVFHRTPGLDKSMVLSPSQVGGGDKFDLLIVDETHRLNQRANQPSAAQNKKFGEINERLFGADDNAKTQLDWIRAQSSHQIFLVDAEQRIRPADLPNETLGQLARSARQTDRLYTLRTQMRVKAGADYVEFVRQLLHPAPAQLAPDRRAYEGYDLRVFDDLGDMQSAIVSRDHDIGLARLVAGYAWEWRSKKDSDAFDIELDGCRLRWNSTDKDWINSSGSLNEVGSIHTVQGYDLNYAGVIIGPELAYDMASGRLVVHRHHYRDRKGKENNPRLGRVYSDDDLLEFIVNIYRVLLTRGMQGTYVYACDPALRAYLHRHIGPR